MNKGLKIWLWIILVLNSIVILGNIVASLANPIGFVYVALNVVLIVGIALLLFQQKKLGLFLYVGITFIVSILNIVLLKYSIIYSIFTAIFTPAITYLLMRPTWDEFK